MGIETLYIHTVTVARPTRTSDGQGGWALGYEDAGAVVGRLRPATPSEIVSADQQQGKVSHVFYCSPEADIRRGDLLSGVSGQVVEVVTVREPSHMAHHLEIDCLEIQKEAEQESGS